MESRARFFHFLKMFPFLTKTSCLPFNATWNFKTNKTVMATIESSTGIGRCLSELQKPPLVILYPSPPQPPSSSWSQRRCCGVGAGKQASSRRRDFFPPWSQCVRLGSTPASCSVLCSGYEVTGEGPLPQGIQS